MSKLQELIRELCPDGVEYRKLEEVCEIKRGERVVKSKLLKDGSYPVISGGVNPMGYLNVYNRDSETITVAQYGTAGYVNWQTTKFWANDVCYCLYPELVLNKKYLYYCLKQQQIIIDSMVIKDAIPYHLPLYQLQKLEIPVPPIDVQNEIVRILDDFTNLAAELQAELQARQEQYEYYRNKLLTFRKISRGGGTSVTWMKMSEIGTFIRGNGLQKKDFTDSGVPCIHYGQIYTYYGTSATKTKSFVSEETANKCKKADCGDLIFATVSENVEDVCKCVAWLGKGAICISGDSLAFHHCQNPKYLSYYLQTQEFFDYKRSRVTGTKVIRLHQSKLEQFEIPIPSLEEQARIVSILDKFETLVNDLSQGLPAEIAAVQEQYEYYRDRLLSFPRSKMSA